MEPYRDPAFPAGSFPRAESAAGRVLSLPIYPELSLAALEQAAEAVRVLPGGAGVEAVKSCLSISRCAPMRRSRKHP